jgi:hypothetical protein
LSSGRFKLGDLVTVGKTVINNPDADVEIPPMYMCVDGPADEIEEANQGKVILEDSNVVFIRVYSNTIDNGK